MESLSLILVVVVALAVTSFARRRELQPPIVLALVGIAASFVPGASEIELDPDVILGAVVPPLLYSTALRFSLLSFVRKLGPILVLGVGLVVATALAVGVVGALVVPGLGFSAALVLGAVVAPPDAVSAIAIGRELGLRRRVLAVLTGESLVNDAAALTIFTVAVASITGEHTLTGSPVLLFLYAAAVGVGVGVLVAIAALTLRRRMRDPGLETVLGLILPFAAYVVAEELEASGVLAVITTGFLLGTLSVRFDYATRLQERQVWSAIDVLLEAFVFAYMGLQLHPVLDALDAAGEPLLPVLGGGLVVLAAVLLVRPLWLFLTLGGGFVVEERADDPRALRARRRVGRPGRRPRSRRPRGRRGREQRPRPPRLPEPLTFREAVVVSWTGMRGVVTIAAAAAIPATAEDGPFGGRPQIQAVAYLVAIGTLLLQGTTLPWLIRRLGVEDPDGEQAAALEQRKIADVTRAAAEAEVRAIAADPPEALDAATVEQLADRFARRTREQADDAAELTSRDSMGAVFSRVIDAQRRAVVDGIRDGSVDDEAAREFLETMDEQEAAIATRLRSRL